MGKSETDIKNGPTLSVHSIGPLCLLPRGQRVRLRASRRGMPASIMVQSSEKQCFSEVICSRVHISLPHPFRPKCIIYSLFFPCFVLMSFAFAKIRIREASSKDFPAVAFTNVSRLSGSSSCLVNIIPQSHPPTCIIRLKSLHSRPTAGTDAVFLCEIGPA